MYSDIDKSGRLLINVENCVDCPMNYIDKDKQMEKYCFITKENVELNPKVKFHDKCPLPHAITDKIGLVKFKA